MVVPQKQTTQTSAIPVRCWGADVQKGGWSQATAPGESTQLLTMTCPYFVFTVIQRNLKQPLKAIPRNGVQKIKIKKKRKVKA